MKIHQSTVRNIQEKYTHIIMARIILYKIYHTLGNFHFQIFKNIYYQSTQYDLKNIEEKIGREDDPLFNHPYFQILIKQKQHEYDLKEKKCLRQGTTRS